MGPGAVVPDIGSEKFFCGSEFIGVEEVEFANKILTVAPDVVVFGVFIEHLGHEGYLGLCESVEGCSICGYGSVEVINYDLAVMPDLIVLLVLQSDFIDPIELLVDIGGQGKDSGSPV